MLRGAMVLAAVAGLGLLSGCVVPAYDDGGHNVVYGQPPVYYEEPPSVFLGVNTYPVVRPVPYPVWAQPRPYAWNYPPPPPAWGYRPGYQPNPGYWNQPRPEYWNQPRPPVRHPYPPGRGYGGRPGDDDRVGYRPRPRPGQDGWGQGGRPSGRPQGDPHYRDQQGGRGDVVYRGPRQQQPQPQQQRGNNNNGRPPYWWRQS